MRRRTFDMLLSVTGLLLALILAVAGGLMWWASSFVSSEVHDQLVAQKVVFPAAGSPALTSLPPPDKAEMEQYAGQTMSTGAQAKTYADHFIAVHLNAIGGGKTYSELSAQALANPTDKALAAQVETVFKGETLRGLLLNAYAFGTMGEIARIGSIASFVGALAFLLLAVLGFRHLGRTPPEEELMAGDQRAPAPLT
jgi:hypothetical protein